MIVEVTQEMIDTGLRCSSSHCPVAKGIEAVTSCRWSVGLTEATLLDEQWNSVRHVRLPREVTYWIGRYDMKEPVAPFSFEFPWEKPT